MAGYKILIVEDDGAIARAQKEHLEQWGFTVRCVKDFRKVLSDVAEFCPDLILLDIKLPFYNGFYLCAEIRKFSTPIVFVSSADEEMNIVTAMDMGGDDFIAKPFAFSVLTAKINAVLRRTYSFSGMGSLLEHKGLRLNLSDATAEFDGAGVSLTRNVNVARIRKKLKEIGVEDYIVTKKGIGYLV